MRMSSFPYLPSSPHKPNPNRCISQEENNIVHNQKVEILRKMLQKEQERLQVLGLCRLQ